METTPKLVTAIVLTKNESCHIARCIKSIQTAVDRVVVVDSNSTDNTREVASELGADVYNNPWTNYATQFNWALDNTHITTEWILRIDADEVITPELAQWVRSHLHTTPPDTVGYTLRRRLHFMGQWIRHGGTYPRHMLRLWRNGKGRCEQRWMDEHIQVAGKIAKLSLDFEDINLNTLTWWIDKHNSYASREAIDILLRRHGKPQERDTTTSIGEQAALTRHLKHSVYERLPLGLRCIALFLYRYVMRLGFLDGARGLHFHALQCLWYRYLVDLKVREVESHTPDPTQLTAAIHKRLGIAIATQSPPHP